MTATDISRSATMEGLFENEISMPAGAAVITRSPSISLSMELPSKIDVRWTFRSRLKWMDPK